MIKPVGYVVIALLIPLQVIGATYLLRLARKHQRFHDRATTADGIVVGTRNLSEGEQFARIFYSVNGAEYMLTSDTSRSQWPRFKKGQVVKVYYTPEAPGSGRLAEPFAPAIFIGGAVLVAATAIMLIIAVLSELKIIRWMS